MNACTPRYKASPSPEDLPKEVKKPDLKVCQIVDDKLVLPTDVRSMFLSCPVFGPEWRELLTSFDKQWASPLTEPASTGSPIKQEVKTESGESGGVKREGEFDWANCFPGEPVTYVDLKKKHGADHLTEMPATIAGLVVVLAPGPSLYLMGKDTVSLDIVNPIITHGPGTWLLGDKASKFQSNSPGKGFTCEWTNDMALVCLEETLKHFKIT